MRAIKFLLLTFLLFLLNLLPLELFAKDVQLQDTQNFIQPKYNETELKKEFDKFMESIDSLKIAKDYPKAVKKLLSGNPDKQKEAFKTLSATGEIEVIPWLLPFVEVKHDNLNIYAALYLEEIVSNYTLKRRDREIGEYVIIKPLRPEDTDLRPLAWIILNMFRKPDDGNTHAYAATMTRYLSLYEFERELQNCLTSRHPAVSNKAKWAIESLNRQKEYGQKIVNKTNKGKEARIIDVRLRIRNDSSDGKVITRKKLIEIKKYILKKGQRGTYCNMYNDNPAFHTRNFSFYLNPDTGQGNINCDPGKSDFNSLAIRINSGGSNQYRYVDFIDEQYVYITTPWPSEDLSVAKARQLAVEAILEILNEM